MVGKIIVKRVNCLWWRSALAGREPTRKYVIDLGVLLCSLSSLWRVLRKCPSIMASSDWLSTREARPDSSTGTPYSWFSLSEAVGLPLCLLARPQGNKACIAFLCMAILSTMWGKLPAVLLSTPTCSAYLTLLTGSPLIVISWQFSARSTRNDWALLW